MWAITRPTQDTGTTFALCISKVRNPAMRRRLAAIRGDIENAADDYIEKANNRELYLITPAATVAGVPGQELVKTYTSRMAKKGQPGRPVYDDLIMLATNDRCPFCDHRNVSTLDHVLPKGRYPVFAVTPVNLVASCRDCNTLKLTEIPTGPNDTVLHPYFDDIDDECWLGAEVIESAPAAITFHVYDVDSWDDELIQRLRNQFSVLELASLYSSQAATEIADIRHNMQLHFGAGGADAVRAELERQFESRSMNRLNSWKAATYRALSQSDWYCNGGFSAI